MGHGVEPCSPRPRTDCSTPYRLQLIVNQTLLSSLGHAPVGVWPLPQWFSFRCDTLIGHSKTQFIPPRRAAPAGGGWGQQLPHLFTAEAVDGGGAGAGAAGSASSGALCLAGGAAQVTGADSTSAAGAGLPPGLAGAGSQEARPAREMEGLQPRWAAVPPRLM